MNVRLIDVQPFNVLFYKSCFFNSLFPVLNKFNTQAVLGLMVNDVAIYKVNRLDEMDIVNCEYLPVVEPDDLLLTYGIETTPLFDVDNIVHELITSLDKGTLSVVWIDCFYEPGRTDTWARQHISHTLLINGYDVSSRTFFVLEHPRLDSLHYRQTTIEFSDLEKSFDGYRLNFHKGKEPVVYQFSKTFDPPKRELSSFHTVYAANQRLYVDEVMEGIRALSSFSHVVSELMALSPSSFREELIRILNNIVNSKKAELYKFNALFPDATAGDRHRNLITQILEGWDTARATIVKQLLTRSTDNEKLQSVRSRLIKVSNLERDYYCFLCEL